MSHRYDRAVRSLNLFIPVSEVDSAIFESGQNHCLTWGPNQNSKQNGKMSISGSILFAKDLF